MGAKVEIDIRDALMQNLKELDRDLAWLQRQTGIPYSTLYSICVQKVMYLDGERLDTIREVPGITI